MGWLGGLLRRLGGQPLVRAEPPQRLQPDEPADDPGAPGQQLLIDAGTRTFWSRGAVAPTTLVETTAYAREDGAVPRRISALAASGQLGAQTSVAPRPRGNPAFGETVFVELMRAGRYERAFALLAPECQRRWGSARAFAAENSGGSMAALRGVSVKSVRFLPTWSDPQTGATHEHVAELDVEYALAAAGAQGRMARTVHLVAVDGKWRSICYPQRQR